MSMGTRSARAGEVRPGAQAQRVLSSPGRVATVRGAYRTAEAGSSQYVRYVGPWGQAALRLPYVPNAAGSYA